MAQGKSTILNGVIKKAAFASASGMAEGGRALHVQHVVHDGRVFTHTPGLMSLKAKEMAAAEIQKGLCKGSKGAQPGEHKILFFMTAPEMLISASDKATIHAVLEAVPEMTDYSIIVNRLTVKEMEKFTGPEAERNIKELEFGLFEVAPKCRRPNSKFADVLFFQPTVVTLANKPNQCLDNIAMERFIVNAPHITVTGAKVTRIQPLSDELVHASQVEIDELKAELDRVKAEEKKSEELQSRIEKLQHTGGQKEATGQF